MKMNLTQEEQDQIRCFMEEGVIAGGANLVGAVSLSDEHECIYWVDELPNGDDKLCWFFVFDYYSKEPIWRFQANYYSMQTSPLYGKYRENALHTEGLGEWTLTQHELLEGTIVRAIGKYSAERLRGITDHPPQQYFYDKLGGLQIYTWTPAANELELVVRRKKDLEREGRVLRGESRMQNGFEIVLKRSRRR